jgi:crotonobetainyl-CoA:carnitine CoA-transferase CaiB-like acyl-CoA transferase
MSGARSEAGGAARPLDGVRILALEQQQSLPYATQLLARLGADVVKVEHPDRGETGRETLPALTDPDGRRVGVTFLRNNLGKRSVTVDLKRPEGRDLVLRLAPRFDVVAENFKAGTVERLGLAYADVVAVHPDVVYVSVSGFGAGSTGDGPSAYSGWPAYAPIAEAMASLYDFKRRPDEEPVPSPLGAIGDTGTALFAALGVLAALRHRDVTGRGQHVDIAMYDAMVAMADAGLSYWSMGLPNALQAPAINHGFRASDGFVVVMCSRVAHFRNLAAAVGHPEWVDDPRLADPPGWVAHLDDVLRPGIEAWAAGRTRHEVAAALAAVGVACGPVHSPADVVADPHVRARNMVVAMPRPDGVEQPVLTPGNPVKLSLVREAPETRVPWLGEHTDAVLHEELDLTASELAALRAAGVI